MSLKTKNGMFIVDIFLNFKRTEMSSFIYVRFHGTDGCISCKKIVLGANVLYL